TKPVKLPYSSLNTLFKGRSQFLLRLRASLTRAQARPSGITATAIYGLGGTGKTRVAVEYALAHGDHYTARWLVSADTPQTLRSGLARLAAAVGMEQSSNEELMLQSAFAWLKSHPDWLVIFDGVETPSALTEAMECMGCMSGGQVLITTR